MTDYIAWLLALLEEPEDPEETEDLPEAAGPLPRRRTAAEGAAQSAVPPPARPNAGGAGQTRRDAGIGTGPREASASAWDVEGLGQVQASAAPDMAPDGPRSEPAAWGWDRVPLRPAGFSWKDRARRPGELPPAAERVRRAAEYAARPRQSGGQGMPPMEPAAGRPGAESLDRALERDARRYDGGFALY